MVWGCAARTGRPGRHHGPVSAPGRGRGSRDGESRLERDRDRRLRWTALGASVAVCLLAYLHVLPLPFGMTASCAIPLIWAIDAYRAENRLMFVLSAVLLLVTALPLLFLARSHAPAEIVSAPPP